MSTSATDDARATQIEFDGDSLVVSLADGRSLRVPLTWFPRLLSASAAERSEWRLIGDGVGIHWPKLDEDLSVAGLLHPRARRTA